MGGPRGHAWAGSDNGFYRDVQRIPESWNMGVGGFVLGSLTLYLKGMRRMMFQLSGFYKM